MIDIWKKNKGLTLVELLIVITIIGALTAIAIPGLQAARAHARDARRIEDLRLLAQALEMYYNEYNHYPVWFALKQTQNGQVIGDCVTYNPPSCIGVGGAINAASSPLLSADFQKFLSPLPNDPLAALGQNYYYQSSDAVGTDYILVFAPEKNIERDFAQSPDLSGYSTFFDVYSHIFPAGTLSKGVIQEVLTGEPLSYTYQLDNQIKLEGDLEYTDSGGRGIQNLTGIGQSSSLNIDNSEAAVYHIKVENDGEVSDSFTITEESREGCDGEWTIAYHNVLLGESLITDDITGNGWPTGTLAPSSSKEIRADVTAPATGNGTCSFVLLATSAGDASKQDAVVGEATVAVAYQPDNWVRKETDVINGAQTWTGNNVTSSDGSNQVSSQTINVAQTATYYLTLENDSAASDSFSITAVGTDCGSWTTHYYDALTGGNEITLSGWVTSSLAAGVTQPIRAEITAPGSGTGVCSVLITSTSQGDGTKKDAVKLDSTLSATVYQPDNEICRDGACTWIGFDIFNLTGDNQSLNLIKSPDNWATFLTRVTNHNADNSDSFFLRETGRNGCTGWTITYLSGSADITNQITAEGWSTGVLAGSASKSIKWGTLVPAGGGSCQIILTSTSVANNNQKDTARGSVNLGPQPDVAIKTSGDYVGSGVNNDNGTNPTVSGSTTPGAALTYYIKILNYSADVTTTFNITGTAGDSDWTVDYYDATSGGNPITNDIIGDGWPTASLAPGDYKEIRVTVNPGVGGNTKDLLITATTSTYSDVVKASTSNSLYWCSNISGWSWDGSSCVSGSNGSGGVSWNKGSNDTKTFGSYNCVSNNSLAERMTAFTDKHWSEIVSSVDGVTINPGSDDGSAGAAKISAIAISDCIDGSKYLVACSSCSSQSDVNAWLSTWASASGGSSLAGSCQSGYYAWQASAGLDPNDGLGAGNWETEARQATPSCSSIESSALTTQTSDYRFNVRVRP